MLSLAENDDACLVETDLKRTPVKWFDPYRTPKTTCAQWFIAEISTAIETHEQRNGLRQRKRRDTDQRAFEDQIAALVSNLALMIVHHDMRHLAVPRSNRALGGVSRYKPPYMTKKFVDLLEDMDLIYQELGTRNDFGKTATLIWPTDSLVDAVEPYGLSNDDFGKREPSELIILKDSKDGFFEQAKLIDYKDDAHTDELRADVMAVNAFIGTADLRFNQHFANGRLIDTDDRCVRRIFSNQSFECGGRLFGGFWQELTKDQRRRGLTINGEPVVGLDYGQMILRLAYGQAGRPLPDSDLYRIEPYQEHRDGLKKLVSAALFARKPLTRKPRGTGSMLPRKRSVGELMRSVTRYHHGISHMFYTGIGHHLMFLESQVLIAVLKELRSRSIVALPVHDSLVAPSSHVLETTLVMNSVFESMLGVRSVVTREW